MKTSAFIATLLTFLMVILVLGAAVFFLWQGRQLLRNEVTSLASEVASAASTATAVRAYAEARDAAAATSETVRATSEAALATSQAGLASSEQTRESMSLARATLQAQSATQEAMLGRLSVPYVEFGFPEDEASVTANSSLQLVVAVGHPSGIDRLALYGLGDTVLLPGGSSPYRVYTHRLEPPLAVGTYTITATVTSRNQESASDMLRFTVVRAPTALPTPESSLWDPAGPDGLAAMWP
jgi:hypothetical protein